MPEYEVVKRGAKGSRRRLGKMFAPCVREAETEVAMRWPGKRLLVSRLLPDARKRQSDGFFLMEAAS